MDKKQAGNDWEGGTCILMGNWWKLHNWMLDNTIVHPKHSRLKNDGRQVCIVWDWVCKMISRLFPKVSCNNSYWLAGHSNRTDITTGLKDVKRLTTTNTITKVLHKQVVMFIHLKSAKEIQRVGLVWHSKHEQKGDWMLYNLYIECHIISI